MIRLGTSYIRRYPRGNLSAPQRTAATACRRRYSSAPSAHAHLGLDLGGSCGKAVALVQDTQQTPPQLRALLQRYPSAWAKSLKIQRPAGNLYFSVWPREAQASALQAAAAAGVAGGQLFATGGGAMAQAPAFLDAIATHLQPIDEIDALASGFSAVVRWPGEVFSVDLNAMGKDAPPNEAAGLAAPPVPLSRSELPWEQQPPAQLVGAEPCNALLVNIGSGVSVVHLTAAHGSSVASCTRPFGEVAELHRVTGSSIGGATFLALAKLLTPYRSFGEAVRAAERGDNGKVALLVKDIYGERGYHELGLPGDVVAADFGKLAQGAAMAASPPDLARALLVLVLNNIAQVSYLAARQTGADRVFYTGGFLRRGLMMRILTSALSFWSSGSLPALFMRHQAFLGAVGALQAGRDGDLL